MSPCHNLEPSLVARDSSRLLSVKPNEWMHLSPFYTHLHGQWLRYAKSTSQFHWRFLFSQRCSGPPSGNGGYVRNLDVLLRIKPKIIVLIAMDATNKHISFTSNTRIQKRIKIKYIYGYKNRPKPTTSF